MRFLATPSFRPFLFMMRHRCVQTSFAGFLRWFIRLLHFRVMTMSGVPSPPTIFMPWPGKDVELAERALVIFHPTILRGLWVSFLVSRLLASLSLSLSLRRRRAARVEPAVAVAPRGGEPGSPSEPSSAVAARGSAAVARPRRRPWACHDLIYACGGVLRPSLAAKDRSGSRTAAVSECCKDSLWLATASTHAVPLRCLRSHSNEHFYRLGFALADLAPPLRPALWSR